MIESSAATKNCMFFDDQKINFKEAFEHSPIGTAIFSIEGKVLEANSSLCDIAGYSKEELLQIDFHKTTHPDDIEKDLKYLDQLFNNEIKSYQIEKRYIHKNGQTIWLQLNVTLIYKDSGEPVYYLSQIQDITKRKINEEILTQIIEEREYLNKKLQTSYNEIETKVKERTSSLEQVIEALRIEIQQHKKTQEDLNNSEKMYQDLYDNAPDMYASVDSESANIIQCNNTLSLATGYTKDEIMGMKIFDLYHPDCHLGVNEAFNQFITNGEVHNKELQIKRKNDSRIDVSLNVSSIRDEDGKIIRSRSSWRDISEQKILEKKLHETITKLSKKSSFEKILRSIGQSVHNSIDPQIVLDNTVQSLLENLSGIISACVYIADENTAYIKAQKGLPEWYLKRAGELPRPRGFTWKTIIENKLIYCPDIDQDQVIGPAGKMLGTKSYISIPINIENKTIGALILHSLSKNAFDPDHIDLIKIAASQIEVAFNNAQKADDLLNSREELKALNESLEQKVNQRTMELSTFAEELKNSNKELEQFAYVASHDLQEPLRKVKSFTELFASKYKGNIDEKADQYINFIVDGSARMQALISDLLEYSRVGRKNEDFSEVNLNETVNKVIFSLEIIIHENNAKIECGLLPNLKINENDIYRVLLNLINNAIKFKKTDTNPIIKISSEKTNDAYIISVKDNGIGIEEQYLSKIFGIFERLHTRMEYPGTGIGLAICKKIIEKCEGRIWVESKKNEGTSFYFSIPIKGIDNDS
ncbi:MAG: PAS domain S-box protein [Thermodesulfobacteriota bacterium]